jgi:hypothetical protein
MRKRFASVVEIPMPSVLIWMILDELRQPNSSLTRAVIAMASYHPRRDVFPRSRSDCLTAGPTRAL